MGKRNHPEKSIKLIRKEMAGRKMIWCHGLFAPYKIMKKDGRYYLFDFGHAKLYPEGYELSFIIWADWIMPADWELPYSQWRKGIFEWLKETEPVGRQLKIKNFKSLMRASLVERITGTILADICATDRPRNEKIKRVELLCNLLDEILM